MILLLFLSEQEALLPPYSKPRVGWYTQPGGFKSSMPPNGVGTVSSPTGFATVCPGVSLGGMVHLNQEEPLEIRGVFIDHKSAPVSGEAVYVIVDEGNHKVTLFHPWYLSEVVINQDDYAKGARKLLWPENETKSLYDVKKVVHQIEGRVEFFHKCGRLFPLGTTKRVLAALKGESVTKVENSALFKHVPVSTRNGTKQRISSSAKRWHLTVPMKKADLEVFKGRRREILEVLIKGPASETAIADVIKYQPKMKVSQDPVKVKLREVHWTLENDLKKKGLVDN